MTTLSLFDEPAAFEPGTPAVDPETVRGTPPFIRPARAGGLTLPVLAFAALVASPAIWQCVVRHELPAHVMLERYVLIAIGCLAVSEVARRLLPQPAETPDVLTSGGADGGAGGGAGGGADGTGGDAASDTASDTAHGTVSGGVDDAAHDRMTGSVDAVEQAPADTLLMRSAPGA